MAKTTKTKQKGTNKRLVPSPSASHEDGDCAIKSKQRVLALVALLISVYQDGIPEVLRGTFMIDHVNGHMAEMVAYLDKNLK